MELFAEMFSQEVRSQMFEYVLNMSAIFGLSWTKMFAIALMLKSSKRLNCQNDGVHEKFN